MKVSREQAAENRSRVVEVAGRLFRERGFDGIGVADLMQAAGLTHGGFYGQFESKDQLAAEATERALERNAEAWQRMASDGGDPLAALLQGYLSLRHRDRTGEGCVLAALAADVARSGTPALRRIFTQGLEALLGRLTALLPGRSKAARRRKALAKAAAMIGALILARAADDAALSEELLAAVREE